MSMLEMIVELRGGLPQCCDFCERPYTEERYPVPEEAGSWACINCWNRWEALDNKPFADFTREQFIERLVSSGWQVDASAIEWDEISALRQRLIHGIPAMSKQSEAKLRQLVEAAKSWASFQEGDSFLDQETDERLRARAIEARERLLTAIEALD